MTQLHLMMTIQRRCHQDTGVNSFSSFACRCSSGKVVDALCVQEAAVGVAHLHSKMELCLHIN